MTPMRTMWMTAGLTLGVWGTMPAFGALPADDFNDNSQGPEWTLVQDDPSLALSETNGRLEVLAANPTSPNFDALYLSNGPVAGFRLSTASDFSIAIDYNFASFTSSVDDGLFSLVFGVGKDLDGYDSAAIGFARNDIGPGVLSALVAAYRTDDVQSPGAAGPAASSGTFLITYNAAGDDLSLGLDGSPALFTLADTVQTVWNANDLFVSFGARGSGFTTTSGQAFFEDFEVRSGTVVPEPAAMSLVAFGGLWLRRRRV